MKRKPTYNVVDGGPDWETVALRGFGGELGDREAAWILLSRSPAVRIVAPATRNEWSQAVEDQFQDTVRALAETYSFGRSGPVSVVFDPPDIDKIPMEELKIPEGEPIDRPDR